MLKDVESAWKARKQQVATEKKKEVDKELALGTSALSEYSEDLAPNCFQVAHTASFSSLDAATKCAMISEGKYSDKADDSDLETDFEDEMECTQALDDDETDDNKQLTLSYGNANESGVHVDDTGTEAYSLSDTGTQPYGDSTYNDGYEMMEGEQKEDADITQSGESAIFSPVVDPTNGQRDGESENTSRESSQIKVGDTSLDYLTPRANVTRVEKLVAAGNATTVPSVIAPNHAAETELEIDDDQDECMATQPSEDRPSDEPAGEPRSTADQNAIRTLEFSFTSTGSQENEVQFDASLSGMELLASKTAESAPRSAQMNPFESSISPVWPPTPIPVNDLSTPEDTILHIFEGYSFGIVCNAEARDKVDLMKFILEACGADAVDEDMSIKGHNQVDIVLCDEYTKVCQYYKTKRNLPVKDFQWVTECMILQRLLDPGEHGFEPQCIGRDSVSAASAEIGDNEKTTLKLYTGELVLADVSGNEVDHFLIFNVCEIISIHLTGRSDEGSPTKKKGGEVMLRVGILKRDPNSAGLYKFHTRVVDIPASQVKRRVVAVSKEDFDSMGYRDESIFYFENEDEDEDEDQYANDDVDRQPSQRQRLTQ
ncbi:hypothetical protein BBO99_00002022 [Phytophthora kernoviae]|uniref:BRCT domain-containing protein n=1 Tax=Phytophthora kernoviae TaxID=325452 RepID=A0A421EZK6_9STRA|nr:hypothetical protein JM16_000027 [Phytophthora kernoviae]KAG2533568.1 hypothetical protein JM18_000029 [Phytophthora kernoviae]RLN11040.1 hypothetical protein BBI17_000191 [Phytophthora kernoviae]RLN86139.1 hypothetical protein BBO99_00002022 [Phytophthora kernoviae]